MIALYTNTTLYSVSFLWATSQLLYTATRHTRCCRREI